MAGGTWTSQNKILPGVYINVVSRENVNVNIGNRGIVAIPEALSWGEPGVVKEILPGEVQNNIYLLNFQQYALHNSLHRIYP